MPGSVIASVRQRTGEETMKNIVNHFRRNILRGLLAVIPIVLCAIAIQLLYVLIDKRVMGLFDNFFSLRYIPGLGILLVLVCLYLIGIIASNIVGRQFFKLVEGITNRIPIIKPIYAVGKQLSHSFSMGEDGKQAFKKAVLVNVNQHGVWSPAFITGYIKDKKTHEELFLVFVPSVPNPTTGFAFVVKPSQTLDPGWSIEECLKAVMSAGIITPGEIQNNK